MMWYKCMKYTLDFPCEQGDKPRDTRLSSQQQEDARGNRIDRLLSIITSIDGPTVMRVNALLIASLCEVARFPFLSSVSIANQNKVPKNVT